jgi:hypothetical protein
MVWHALGWQVHIDSIYPCVATKERGWPEALKFPSLYRSGL